MTTQEVANNALNEQKARERQEKEQAAQNARIQAAKAERYRQDQESNKIVEENVLTRISPDYMLRATREGVGDKNILRYDQEYYFFKSLLNISK